MLVTVTSVTTPSSRRCGRWSPRSSPASRTAGRPGPAARPGRRVRDKPPGHVRTSPWIALCRSGSDSDSCWVDALEGVAAVPDPVGPGQQLLTASAVDDLVGGESTDHVAVLHRVRAQGCAHLGDDRATRPPGRDLVLVSGRVHGCLLVMSRTLVSVATILFRAMTETHTARTYQIRTHGCQMNVHDSERLAGLLEEAGYARASESPSRPTWSFSTPARCGRTPTTGCTATSASSLR